MPKSIYKPYNSKLRHLLIEARKSSGLTQLALSQKLHKPQSFISKYESGERRLDVIEFIEITQSLGMNPAKIISRLISK